MFWFIIISVLVVITFASLIERKRKKINNHPLKLTHPNAKPGDSSNYLMGDNRHTDGVQ
ncbi:hypothetical protein ACQKP0_13380 [Heyndrickxia sp. NPDC080065]|uniref:hypothetical protein n=1 Tax=Heyndrickxia sp. NPDC080065 TaxID=3390568 RepID=UPI003D02BA95